MPWFHQIMKSEIPRISFHSLNPTERLTKNRTCQLIWWVQITKFGEPCETLWNQWGLKGQMRLRKSFGPIVWSSFLPDSHSGTYQCARSSVCARLRLACAWHYNVAKEFPSSRILHPLKKWCDYEFTTLNFWNVDFSQAKSSVTSLSGFCLNDDYQQNKFWNMMRKKPERSIEFPSWIERRLYLDDFAL